MNSYLLVLTVLVAAAAAMPRYALVPVEELRQAPPHLRVARQAPRLVPRGPPQDDREVYLYAEPSENRPVRQAGYGNHEQVDYGAYTGGYGAFGWYADYPVYSYGHH